jgi:hypothetical protein
MDNRLVTSLACAAALLCAAACSSSAPPPNRPAHGEGPSSSDRSAAAARISGDWQIAIERGGSSLEGWLHFALTEGELVGSLTGPDSNSREISKITVKGEKISWVVAGESRTEHYEGTLKGASMEGTMKIGPGSTGRRGGGEGEGSGRTGGGYGGHRGGGGGRGGSGGSGSSGQITWRAFRSVPVTPAPAAKPTKPPSDASSATVSLSKNESSLLCVS